MSATDAFQDRPATIADYAAILRRRKWIVLALPTIAAVCAYLLSAAQSPRYESKTQVSFRLSNIPQQLANVAPTTLDPEGYLRTQAVYARSAELARRVVDAAQVPGITPGEFLGNSSANARTDGANILDLSASASHRGDAARLADAYASEFVKYTAELAAAPVRIQLANYRERIKKLRAGGDTASAQALFGKMLDLETLGEQLAKNASVIPHESSASQTRPRPRRNAILGALLGLVLGVGLAFLAEALDKRVRSEQEIEQVLGLPLLGRLPRPARRLRQENKLVMLDDPRGIHSETFRKLRTSVEFVNFERAARTIMITSAGPREGKSTTIANLAVALARAGRKVALVDLDLRRPFLHTFFGVDRGYGITDVVVDRVALEAAARKIALPAAQPPRAQRKNGRVGVIDRATRAKSGDGPGPTNGRAETDGVMVLLPAGTMPPAPDEFLESERLGLMLDRLANEADIVLIDAPPLLAVGDVLTLSAKVDAIIVAAHVGIHRRHLQELARQLQNCRAEALGLVVTGVAHGDSYGYGYGYDPHVYVQPEPERTRERT